MSYIWDHQLILFGGVLSLENGQTKTKLVVETFGTDLPLLWSIWLNFISEFDIAKNACSVEMMINEGLFLMSNLKFEWSEQRWYQQNFSFSPHQMKWILKIYLTNFAKCKWLSFGLHSSPTCEAAISTFIVNSQTARFKLEWIAKNIKWKCWRQMMICFLGTEQASRLRNLSNNKIFVERKFQKNMKMET